MNQSLKQKLQSFRGSAGLGQLSMAKAIYSFPTDGGAEGTHTLQQNVTLPNNAVIVGATVNSTEEVTSGGDATVAIGTLNTDTDTILEATAIADLGADALVNGAPTFASPLKTTDGTDNVTVTIAVAALTAGVIEVVLFFYTANE